MIRILYDFFNLQMILTLINNFFIKCQNKLKISMGQYLNFNKNTIKKEPEIFIELISTTLLKSGLDLFDDYSETKLVELHLQRNWAVKSLIKKKI
jgi:hypothetical protein